MSWKNITFDWNQARAFLVTAEKGSLSAAARALGQTQPTLSRQVAAIEEHLGLTLFERVGKSLVLTQTGTELLQHVRDMGEAASKVSLAASGKSQSIKGKVSITASDVMAAEQLPDFLKILNRQAPAIEVELVAENQISDLLRREADIAIRHVRPEQPDLIARLVGEASAGFYASSEYLDKHGRPNSIDQLDDHKFVGFGDNERMIAALSEFGISLKPEHFVWNSKNGVVAWQMAKVGLGICIMSDQVANSTNGVEKLHLNSAPITFPIWLATHRELHTSGKIRLVFDMLADYLTELNRNGTN